MTERLVTERELRGVLERLRKAEQRIGTVEVIEKPIYATGSFVPTLVGSGTAGTFTYASGTLVEWTRIGNRLFFNGRVTISATSVAPTLNMTINGWPYAGVVDANMLIAGIAAIQWRNVDVPAGFTSITLQFTTNTTPSLIRSGDNVNSAIVQGAELTGGVYDFRFGGNYRVA